MSLQTMSIANDSNDDALSRMSAVFYRLQAYRDATQEMGFRFAIVFCVFGLVAVLVNIFVMFLLLRHRRRVFRHIFYILVMNFAVIDILKGLFLILWSGGIILKPPTEDEIVRVVAVKIDQITLLILRTFNLETIFNLLLITFNEYFFIKFPLSYDRLVNQSRWRKILTALVVIVTWLVSIGFTIASTFVRSYDGKTHTIYVWNGNGSAPVESGDSKSYYKRDQANDDLSAHHIFQFTLLGFCIACLVTILICYASFFRLIRKIRENDEKMRGETARRPSKLSLQSTVGDDIDNRRQSTLTIKRQLIGRNKYVLVIGLVIAVYLLYLLSYGTIQLFQFFNLRVKGRSHVEERKALVIRSALQVLVGIHAVLQPICYFRMKDFRLLAYATFQSAKGRRANAFAASILPNTNGGVADGQSYAAGGPKRISGVSTALRKMSEAPVDV